ncbi:hypothetical protein [Marinibactrum halimedae]|nr:hypothetical protein [Marinibactrum halimedae]
MKKDEIETNTGGESDTEGLLGVYEGLYKKARQMQAGFVFR